MPTSAQRLWGNLGLEGNVSEVGWSESTNWSAPLGWLSETPEPLFERLDLDEIMTVEQGFVVEQPPQEDAVHGVKGGKKKKGGKKVKEAEGITYLDFESFMNVDLRTGTIVSVDDHPNADRLYVVKINDGSEEGRTICAGLKEYYKAEEMIGKSVVFVANLAPRKLRGVTSEGMMLAADDGDGNVKLITLDGDMKEGSQVR